MRALILSWEYPPLIEGGLARHVRKLAENMAALGDDAFVRRSSSPSTEPNTAATRAGSTGTRSPTSTASSAGWRTAPSA
jgi:hypothetical protein